MKIENEVICVLYPIFKTHAQPFFDSSRLQGIHVQKAVLMRKILLLALMLSGMISSAQNRFTDGSCKAFFKYAVNDKLMSPIAGTTIDFFDKSEGNVIAWFWDFGDGNTSRQQNPSYRYTYPLPATNVKMSPYRTVVLTILTSDSCKSLYSETINIMDGNTYQAPLCKAGFKYYQAAYDVNGGKASFQLTNLSEGDSLSYFWTFDNGTTSTEKEPIVTFDIKPAQHQVCLKVTGKNNSTDSFCDYVTFTDPNAPIVYPAECKTYFKYSINYEYKTLLPALVLDFYADASPEGIAWNWDFGDGITNNEQNPTHIFNFPLTNDSILGDPNPFRKVCLTVTTVSGCMASYCETINIYMNTTKPGDQCHAWFKFEKATDVVSIPGVIPYKLWDVSDGKVVSWQWQFEDGSVSFEQTPVVNFDFQKPTQKVCLTILTADSCSSTWCETIYVSEMKSDTIYTGKPLNGYSMHYISSFPIYMSSCAGYAKAQVYLKDSLVNAINYVWSTGEEGQEVKGLCPTQTYSVKATTPDGTIVTGTFVFNSDGSVTDNSINWWVSGGSENSFINCKPANKGYTVEWQLCDGTIVKSDSISLNSINCGDSDLNLIMRDSAGNQVYTENISMKSLVTSIGKDKLVSSVKFFPNPVSDVLNIQYSGKRLNEMQVEIFDITGKSVLLQMLNKVESGQNIGLNVRILRSGVYLCKLLSDKQIIATGKFVK